MADHGHHDPGGHELEAINTKLLFRLLISLSAVTLLAAIAVVQWFYSQRRELEQQLAAEGSFQLIDYKTKMSAELEGIDRIAQNMVADPALLKAPPPPSGWIHPDDLVGGGAAAAPAAPEHDDHAHDDHAHEVEAPEPTEGAEPEGAEPAEPAEDEADKPIDVPADKPANDKTEPAEPADKADDND